MSDIMSKNTNTPIVKKVTNSNVGFANMPLQVHKKSIKKGFNFTIMVVGETGIGKSTLVNTLFDSNIFPQKDETTSATTLTKGVEIVSMNSEMQEDGVKLNLTVVDTPGFGNYINNEDSWKPIVDNIEARFDSYLTQENRTIKAKIVDNRIDALIYLIKPSGHCLKALDIEFMKRVHSKVNLIPIISKSDTLTHSELKEFKNKIMNDINHNNIQIFKPVTDAFDSMEATATVRDLVSKIPFAVIGSEQYYENENGTSVRGRKYPWGIIEVENESHNDLMKLRKMLISTHMYDLKEITDTVLYENYRTQKLLTMGHVQDNSVFKEVNPSALLEEERKMQELKLQKMESEMNSVFMQKVQEKENKLKQSEEELFSRHKEMKLTLEKQCKELEEKKMKIETSTRAATPMEKRSKKSLFNLS